ncbi:MAG: response regulator [Planctomycetota bacterium]|jgi:DNA-binding response OmpR family regulator
MSQPDPKILLVEPNPNAIEVIVEGLCHRFQAQITCVPDAESCIETDLFEPHDLVITEMELPDKSGLELTEELLTFRSRPVIMLGKYIETEDAIEALRLGVKDFFIRPFVLTEMLDAVERALRGHQIHRRHSARYHRMRELVRHVIRERRSMNRRVDLICRDLVDAQRRLVHKVMGGPEC